MKHKKYNGVNKIMEKSTQSPLTVKEFLVVLSLYRFTRSLQNTANANAVEDAWTLQYALVHSQRMGMWNSGSWAFPMFFSPYLTL